jgi:hypothetical protein
MFIAEASCPEIFGSVADWLMVIAAFAGVIAAVVAGQYARSAYEAQRDQLNDARAKSDEETQLKRFEHGPYFKLFPMNLASVDHFQAANGVSYRREVFADYRDFFSEISDCYRETHGGTFGLMLQDVRDCDLDDIKAVWGNAVGAPACEMLRVSQLDHLVSHPVWALIYTGTPVQFQQASFGDIEIEYKTVNGYADLHVYAHQFGKQVWSRAVPQFVRLNSVK